MYLSQSSNQHVPPNNIGCSITSRSYKSKRSKSPAPTKKLPINNKKKAVNNQNNNQNNNKNKNISSKQKQQQSVPKPLNSAKQLSSPSKTNQIPLAKPSYNAYTLPKSSTKPNKIPLAKPQKASKYYTPSPIKSMPISNNNNIYSKQNGNKKNIHRVKNRPAQNSIAYKLIQQQKAEELERMYDEQEEQDLKLLAKQINNAPLAAANTIKT